MKMSTRTAIRETIEGIVAWLAILLILGIIIMSLMASLGWRW